MYIAGIFSIITYYVVHVQYIYIYIEIGCRLYGIRLLVHLAQCDWQTAILQCFKQKTFPLFIGCNMKCFHEEHMLYH